MRSMGVYLHIPFCAKKCVYCDFLSGPATKQMRQEYVETLKKEIVHEAEKYDAYRVGTIFFGGGTPSILDAEEIGAILKCLDAHYEIDVDAEITIEMNPGTTDRDKLLKLKEFGINRLSIGLQSADNAVLRMLGRIHTYEDFLQTYNQSREAGFVNINVDLMSSLPGQDRNDWRRTLEKVTALQPEHISAYSLMIEEGTGLYHRLEEYPPLPDEDEDRQMDQTAKQILAETGYYRYEISNYARKGYECRHNCIYWQRGVRHIADYAGFGLGASSTVGNVRWKNTDDMEKYLRAFRDDHCTDDKEYAIGKECTIENGQGSSGEMMPGNIKEQIQQLSRNDRMEEFMFLGLRMTNGVSRLEFADTFGVGMQDVYDKVLRKWVSRGMLVQSGDCIRLTDAGIDVSNMVLADFLI
ncbi:MAG: radical SAM family heme chaperone HemW [Lachnospiraceae bacterium]|nr:radical SAM family heme chaperone HemW [Lachnospiraceae bacterium]